MRRVTGLCLALAFSLGTLAPQLAAALGDKEKKAIAALDPDAYCSAAEALRTELADDAEGLVSVWKTAP